MRSNKWWFNDVPVVYRVYKPYRYRGQRTSPLVVFYVLIVDL